MPPEFRHDCQASYKTKGDDTEVPKPNASSCEQSVRAAVGDVQDAKDYSFQSAPSLGEDDLTRMFLGCAGKKSRNALRSIHLHAPSQPL